MKPAIFQSGSQNHKSLWFLIVALPTILFWIGCKPVAPAPCNEVTEIPQIECLALLSLYESTDGDNWGSNTGWTETTTPCAWHGVSCEDGHVTRIQLRNNLVGNIPPELGEFQNLEFLDLSHNQLSGIIPPEIGALKKLEFLWLNWNQLDGAIPPELGNLENLIHLTINGNNLNGRIPAELGNLVQLKELVLLDNQLSGVIPDELVRCENLVVLALNDNQLDGDIPSFLGRLRNLEYLNLESNLLSGVIPPKLGNLENLQFLSLASNLLSGSIPVELGGLENLEELYLESNHLSGRIPPEFEQLERLYLIHLDQNLLSGNIPDELYNLDLYEFRIGSNALEGEISPLIMNLENLLSSSSYEVQSESAEYIGCDFSFNMLETTNPDVIDFLNDKDPSWLQTQTLPPSRIRVTDVTQSTVALTWDAIPYTGDGGYYEIAYSTIPDGLYRPHGNTASKASSSYTVFRLEPDTTYYIIVRTFTPAHGGQQNDLWSEYSSVVVVTTQP